MAVVGDKTEIMQVHSLEEIPADKSQSAYEGSVPSFGGGPQFRTGSVCPQNAEDGQAFASFANSDFQTFGDLAQCGANQLIIDQGHRGNEIKQFEKPAENRVDQFFDDQIHRGYETGQFERKEEEEQFSGGDQAAKEETDGENWSHGHPITKTKESDTRTSSFEELGFKFENTSLTNSPFQSTHSPQKPPLRPPTFTIGSGLDHHSEGHAFSQGYPKVASHGFNIKTSQKPYANQVQGVGEIQGDGNQPWLRGLGSAPRFGEKPKFETESSVQNQSEFQNTKANPAFAGYGYSGSQTFAGLAQCGSTQSYSDLGHRAPKEEKDDEDWSRGHRKTEKESETRKSSFEDLGYKFENTSLTNTPFHSTHSPEKPPLRPPTFTIGSGSDQHSEGHAFSQGDPKVASHGFNIQTSQIPYTNRHGGGEIPAGRSQSSYTCFGPPPAFGGRPQFGTGTSFQKQSEFHQKGEDSQAFVGYGYSDSQTFARVGQCGSNISFSDQGHRAAKGETDDEEWHHGQLKIKAEEIETRKPSFEELGYKFENASLTNTPFKSTCSPKNPPLRLTTFTTAGGSYRHSESSAFSEGDPTVTPHVFNFRKPEIPHANQPPLRPPTFTTAGGSNQHPGSSAFSEGDPTAASHVFNFRKPEIPYANRHDVQESPADGSQSLYKGFGPVPAFGGRPQFGTASLFQNQLEFHQNAVDSRAFVGYEYSDYQTFEGLTQCGGVQSSSDQEHRAAKGETDDEEWHHGQLKIKAEESETRKPSFEELGYKFENASLTNTPFKSTCSPKDPPLRSTTFTTAGGSYQHSESSAFSEGDPTVTPHVFNFRKPEIPHANQPPLRPPTFTTAGGSNRHSGSSAFSEGDPTAASHVFNFRKPEIPNANRHNVQESPADGSQSLYRGFGPVPAFGGRPQFGTASSFQNQLEFHQNAVDSRAFVGYEYSDYQTFEGLTQCGGVQSSSDQEHRESPKE